MMFFKETEFKEIPLAEIPMDWDIVKFGNLFTYFKGKKPDEMSKEYKANYFPYLSTEYLRENQITKFAKTSQNVVLVDDGDLLLLWDGSNAGEFFLGKKGVLSSTMVKIDSKEEKYDPRFLYYLLKMSENYLKGQTKGTGIPHVDGNVLNNLTLPVPPRSEQHMIVEVLSVVDLAIGKVDDVIAKTEQLKKGLMQELLTKGIGHKEFKDTKIGKIPKIWKVKYLKEVCDTIVDCPHSTPKFTNKGVLIVRNFNIREGELRLDPAYYTTEEEWFKRTRRCIPESGDILFSRQAPVGEACPVPENTRLSLGQRIMLMRPNRTLLKSLFLVYLFYAPFIQRRLQSLAAGVTAHHVNVGDVRKLTIPLPSLDEQERIATTISSIVKKLQLERKQKAKLERIKQGLIDLLLTGKVRVKVD